MAIDQTTPSRLPKQDFTGLRFGKLVVISACHITGRDGWFWKCKCDCSGEKTVSTSNLKIGHTRSCGCLKKLNGERAKKFYPIPSPISEDRISEIRIRFGVVGEVKPIPEAAGYAVSEHGRVFSTVRCSRCEPEEIRELSIGITGYGYRTARLHIEKKSHLRLVHRIVAAAFLPPPKEGQRVVRHLDGNELNNHYSNLAWGTDADNMQDMIRHGRTLKGLRNHNAKLNPKRAQIIRDLSTEGFSGQAIAAFFGVSWGTVHQVITGQSWIEEEVAPK